MRRATSIEKLNIGIEVTYREPFGRLGTHIEEHFQIVFHPVLFDGWHSPV
jgi:hypothetical protein